MEYTDKIKNITILTVIYLSLINKNPGIKRLLNRTFPGRRCWCPGGPGRGTDSPRAEPDTPRHPGAS